MCWNACEGRDRLLLAITIAPAWFVVVRPALVFASPWLAASRSKQSNHITSRYLLPTKSARARCLFVVCLVRCSCACEREHRRWALAIGLDDHPRTPKTLL